MKYLNKIKHSYKLFKLRREIQVEQKEVDRLEELITSRKKKLLDLVHQIGCSNINSKHIEYIFDNVESYPSRVSMVNWIMDKHIEIKHRRDAIL